MPEELPENDPSAFGFKRVVDKDRAAALSSALAKLQSQEKPMSAPESADSPNSASEIRRLTLAVRTLTLVIALHMVVAIFTFFFTPRFPYGSFVPPFSESVVGPPEVGRMLRSTPPSFSTTRFESFEKYNDFDKWPVEKKFEEASVVILAKFERDGNRYKCVVSEILKKAPNTSFFYKVGDEYQDGSFYPKDGERRGDGQIVFFVGNPAQMKYACSFYGDRISAFGDMPFEELRKLVKK
jgi:hypothetical protein